MVLLNRKVVLFSVGYQPLKIIKMQQYAAVVLSDPTEAPTEHFCTQSQKAIANGKQLVTTNSNLIDIAFDMLQIKSAGLWNPK